MISVFVFLGLCRRKKEGSIQVAILKRMDVETMLYGDDLKIKSVEVFVLCFYSAVLFGVVS